MSCIYWLLKVLHSPLTIMILIRAVSNILPVTPDALDLDLSDIPDDGTLGE